MYWIRRVMGDEDRLPSKGQITERFIKQAEKTRQILNAMGNV